MKTLFNFLFASYSHKAFVSLISLEITRSLFIVLFAWLLQSAIRFTVVEISLFVVLMLRILVENVRNKMYIDIALQIQEFLRKRLHKIVFDNLKSGELLTLLFDTIKVFDDFFVIVLPNILTIAVLIPMILIVATIFDPLTALFFLLTLPIAPFLLYLIGNAIKIKNQAALAAIDKLNFDFKELLTAITTVKIFNQAETAFTKLQCTSQESSNKTLELLKLAFVSAFALELITTLSIAIIAVTIGLRLIDGSINFDIALFLLILASEFYSPIRQIGVAFHVIVRCLDATKQLKNIIGCDGTIWSR